MQMRFGWTAGQIEGDAASPFSPNCGRCTSVSGVWNPGLAGAVVWSELRALYFGERCLEPWVGGLPSRL